MFGHVVCTHFVTCRDNIQLYTQQTGSLKGLNEESGVKINTVFQTACAYAAMI